MTAGHRWPLDETPWPAEAALAYGEMVELTTPEPPVPELGFLGPDLLGTRGVVVECLVERDDHDGRPGPVYSVETEDGSPWRLRPEFLSSLGRLHPGMPPRHRSDLPEGTRVRIRDEPERPGGPAEAVEAVGRIGRITGLWWTTALEPPKGYTVDVDGCSRSVTPQEIEVL
ncbi:hypothetical protein ACFYUY_17675 [Kitasatospora sp. NPDC004745]|uniref:hypothetical protein n=1 Tax=Kitasatospora sp. NPDC004745 TaxID=3364019 RepID=UPI0036948750